MLKSEIHILYLKIARNYTVIESIFEYQAFNEIVFDKLNVAYIFRKIK